MSDSAGIRSGCDRFDGGVCYHPRCDLYLESATCMTVTVREDGVTAYRYREIETPTEEDLRKSFWAAFPAGGDGFQDPTELTPCDKSAPGAFWISMAQARVVYGGNFCGWFTRETLSPESWESYLTYDS